MDEIKNMGSPEDISTIAGLNDETEDVPVARSRRATPKSDIAPSTAGVFSAGGVGAHRGKNRSKGNSADRLASFQAAVVESIDETQRLRKVKDDIGAKGVLVDTVKEVATAASGAYASIREWANTSTAQSSSSSSQHHTTTSSIATSGGPPCPANVCGNESVATGSHLARSSHHEGAISKHSILQDLAWPFALCGIDVSDNLPKQNDLAPHLQKMRDAVAKAVNGDISGSTNDIWKFAAPNSSQHDDDDNTQCSLDTLQEENNQIRRLGSWGTVGTAGTTGTADTDSISLDQPSTPKEINVGGSGGALEDDDGNVIDPLLLQKAKKSREKRKHRKKLVKFDYPPIKSLRQCPRPDPADLPDLFFTEHELDQIEDDRYSTMSTDDIEIVAVASKPGESGQHKKTRKTRTTAAAAAAAAGASTSFAPDGTPGPNAENGAPTSSTPGRDQPDKGYRQVKGRPSTPYRRRATDEEDDAEIPASSSQPKSPENGNNGRLVKGVQIYLRERSTGA